MATKYGDVMTYAGCPLTSVEPFPGTSLTMSVKHILRMRQFSARFEIWCIVQAGRTARSLSCWTFAQQQHWTSPLLRPFWLWHSVQARTRSLFFKQVGGLLYITLSCDVWRATRVACVGIQHQQMMGTHCYSRGLGDTV